MSAKNKLEALKAAFDKKTTATETDNSWKLFFPFWKMPDDSTAIVRFLPDLDEDNSFGFLVEKLTHKLVVNGQKKDVPCLEMFGEDCPVCALSRKHYAEKNDELGKKYYRKKSYIGQVIVVESPIDHDTEQLVKLIDFGPAVFKQIQAAFQSGDLENPPYEFKGGYNFRIKKTKNGQYASYSTSSFAPKLSDLDDDLIEQLNLFNLADFRGKKPDVAAVEAMLLADQTGDALSEQDDRDEFVQAVAEKPAKVAEPVKQKVEAKPAAVSEPPAETTAAKGMSIMEQLRARAKAQATGG